MDAGKVIIASTAPIIKYPDCYGINMSNFAEFLSFKAAISYLQKGENMNKYEEIVQAFEQEGSTAERQEAIVSLYQDFTAEELIREMISIIKPFDFKAELDMVFQSLEGLNKALPDHQGTWYFDGKYPTPGGVHLVYEEFQNFFTANSSTF